MQGIHGTYRHTGDTAKLLTAELFEVIALYPVRANKLGEAAGLNRQDAKIAKPERCGPAELAYRSIRSRST